MKKIVSSISSLALIATLAVVLLSFGHSVQASVVPTISLTALNSYSNQLTVHGDPASIVQLRYGPSASMSSFIGTTDDSGNLQMYFSADSYNVGCGQTAYVLVNGLQSQMIPWSVSGTPCTTSTTTTTSSNSPSFSQNNLMLVIGQSQTVTVSGSGGFTLSSNSNPSSVTSNINGNAISLYAASFGGSSITVCQSDGMCNVLSVLSVNPTTMQTDSNIQPRLSSFTVSSNSSNSQFMGSGTTLTVSFTATKPINNISVLVNGFQQSVSGVNSGPYTFSYVVTGNEGTPIPVVIRFTDLTGFQSQTAFALGNLTTTQTNGLPAGCTTNSGFSSTTGQSCGSGTTTTTTSSTPSTPATSNFVFTSFLTNNSTGNEVTELQKKLTSLGFFTGPITGKFGALTEAAVRAFQKAKGITQAGYVGPGTRAALNQ
jgi:hypothetical protein